MGADLAWSDGATLDLGADRWVEQGRHVARETRLNARNYAAARIASKRYLRDELPSDDRLRLDLVEALPSLLALYNVEPVTGANGAAVTKSVARRSAWGRLKSKAEIDAVDRRAMAVATEHYVAQGWSVEDVSVLHPYDLECRRDTEEVHVEVKGTTMLRHEQIDLTANEVAQCRSYPNMELALVSGIKLDRSERTRPTASAGTLRVLAPWTIDLGDRRLAATRYVFRLVN